MFKSTFVKYVVTFAVILIISFVALSGIVTGTIKTHIEEENLSTLERASFTISEHIAREMSVENLEAYAHSPVASVSISHLVSQDDDLNIVLVDTDGRILLTTVGAVKTDGIKRPILVWDGEYVDMDKFTATTGKDNHSYLVFDGEIKSFDKKAVHVCAREINTKGQLRGYVISFVSSESEALLFDNIRRVIINSSLWVLLAAVIAVYFITERIIHPLKSMKTAAKDFAKGDFSTRLAVVGHDEISELAEAFNNMAESLDNFEKMRNSFLASVSHDLRTPMATISGFIDGITSGAIPPEKHEYYLGVISAEVHRLSRLVSDLLDISRLESGERKFNFTVFDVAEVARIILISFEQKIEEKNLDVIFESDKDEMPVYADKDAIHQVLYNLCHNAIKFAKPGGKFAISITRAENKKIRISVYDEGEAISREELPLVFDRFYKTDKSRGLDKNGVGLGLYICKTIIDAHGETIRAESPSDTGAEFWFTLKEGEQSPKRRLQSGSANHE